MLFAMRVDNDGEGGILALMALLGVKKQRRPTIVAVGLLSRWLRLFHVFRRPVQSWLRCDLVFLVCAAHDNPQRVIRQWPLQRLGLVPWCPHPHIPLFVGGQDHSCTIWGLSWGSPSGPVGNLSLI
jgi:hypothetical protein